MCFHHLNRVSEQVCLSQVLTAGKCDFLTFQSKGLNHFLYFTLFMHKTDISNVFCSKLSVKSETPIRYLMLHASLYFSKGMCLNTKWSLCNVTKTIDKIWSSLLSQFHVPRQEADAKCLCAQNRGLKNNSLFA